VIEDINALVSAASDILTERGEQIAARILSTAEIDFRQVGWDNWDGGTAICDCLLLVPPRTFARLDSAREAVEQEIHKALEPLITTEGQIWFAVKIRPRKASSPEQPAAPVEPLSREIRAFIVERFKANSIKFAGRMEEVEFLSRLYDLSKMPSFDQRQPDAAGDIGLHRDHFCDWDDFWVFEDARFNLMNAPDEEFLKFLGEMVHPLVRTDEQERSTVLEICNSELTHAGWQLVPTGQLAGRKIYGARKRGHTPSFHHVKDAADRLAATYLETELARAERAIYSDPALAIGSAKDAVETCCKTLLNELTGSTHDHLDMPKLAKRLLKELKLRPDDVPDGAKAAETLKAVLGSLASITHGLAELRNPFGTGHGKHGRFKGLAPRHAKLAVSAAAAFITFVVDVYEHRERELQPTDS